MPWLNDKDNSLNSGNGIRILTLVDIKFYKGYLAITKSRTVLLSDE